MKKINKLRIIKVKEALFDTGAFLVACKDKKEFYIVKEMVLKQKDDKEKQIFNWIKKNAPELLI